ncbi:MAG TPA: DUF1501 domain-containing protein [Gemmataceae bacterium]|nr:DUF1501 domain-containing protein [Gemmataceae bacterium]
MYTRRQFLEHSLKSSSLLALGSAVPGFLATTARAAAPGKDTVLVVVEMTGGNDGLNTVIPYADDLYRRARPTLGLKKGQVVRVDDHIGLNPGLRNFEDLLGKGQLAIVQGVGYPNPNRSHFESMDVWQSGDPRQKTGDGWLGRGMGFLRTAGSQIPGVHVGTGSLPLALQGSASGVATIHPTKPYDLDLGGPKEDGSVPLAQVIETLKKPAGRAEKQDFTAAETRADEKRRAARRKLIEELAQQTPSSGAGMLQFVRRRALQTYTSIDRLRKILGDKPDAKPPFPLDRRGSGELNDNLSLVAKIIEAGFGTRIFYVSVSGFDTHSDQLKQHEELLQEVAQAVTGFFAQLRQSGHSRRVVLMTFSEFGRRVRENGSGGTDHGAASCLFVAGPAVKGGVIGSHPSLETLDAGDLKHHTDFRQVYATLLDRWLECDSRRVLGEKFDHIPLLRKR